MDQYLLKRILVFHRVQYCLGGGHHAANAAEELHGLAALKRQADIVHQLADAKFGHKETLDLWGQPADCFDGERIQRERAEQADFMATLSAEIDHGLQDAAHDAIPDNDD